MAPRGNTNKQPQIGDIYLMHFTGCGSEQSGWRPGLVFQNNQGNKYSPNIIALPLTGSIKKTNQPTHVFISAKEAGLIKDSVVLCENPERMSKDKLGNYLTTISPKLIGKVAEANLLASSAISFIEPEVLLSIWEKASVLNSVS